MFEKIDLYEQRACTGGLWNYEPHVPYEPSPVPSTDPNAGYEVPVKIKGTKKFPSPMYDGLETNIPHSLMEYSDDDRLTSDQLFPPYDHVLKYLQNYADEVKYLIRFNTQVQSIQDSEVGGQEQWSISSKSLITHARFEEIYDAVVIASGHYSVPYLPEVEGICEWSKANPGSIKHSREFERPTEFANKKVVVVGNSASGLDICSQISKFSQQPVLMSARSLSEVQRAFTSDGRMDLPEIVQFLPASTHDRAVKFANGQVEEGIDHIMFCTGYLYSFPFLSCIRPPLIDSGMRVQNLYQHIFNIDHPSLAFVGLPLRIIPFRTAEGQAAVIARFWANRLVLPTQAEMRAWEKARLEKAENEKAFHLLRYPEDFDYHNAMVDWALTAQHAEGGKMPPSWNDEDYWFRKRFPDARKRFVAKGTAKSGTRTFADVDLVYNHQENTDG